MPNIQISGNNTTITDCDVTLELLKNIKRLEGILNTPAPIMNAEELENVENELQDICNHIQAGIIGHRLQSTFNSKEFQEEEKALIKRGSKKMTSNGYSEINVTPLCGVAIRVETRIFYGKGRLKKGRMIRPGLILLGIHEKCTSALAFEVSKMTAALASMEEARILLEGRGIDFGINTIRNIAYRYAHRARMGQSMDTFVPDETVKGRVVVCGIDGGRVRIRKNKRGPKTKKNRSHYHTDWREPKLLIIYTVNADGKRDKKFCPFIDGTMKGPDAIFKLMGHYLSKLGVTEADKLVFVSDGAKWIWDRVEGLVKLLGLKLGKVFLTLDFYHAVEHLGKVAKLCAPRWGGKQKKSWLTRQRNRLVKGKIDEVIEEIRPLCKGRKSKSIRVELNYFIKHRDHMDYATNASLGLPIGSGAVESAVRRVINLRIKGPGIFWKKENVEMMLLLRSYYKAGRWELLKKLALSNNCGDC